MIVVEGGTVREERLLESNKVPNVLDEEVSLLDFMESLFHFLTHPLFFPYYLKDERSES